LSTTPSPGRSRTRRAAIERAAEGVLAARARYVDCTLADLLAAHRALDRAVDAAYRKAPFDTERSRVEYLFALYQQLTAPLLPAPAGKARRGRA